MLGSRGVWESAIAMSKSAACRPAIVGAFATRPRLVGATLAGLATGFGMSLAPDVRASTAAAVGWDVLCLVFTVLTSVYMKGRDAVAMRTHAAKADEGRIVVLILILTASIASIAAIAVELSAAKHDRGLARAGHVALGFLTLFASWFFVQLNFALHYAHAYYRRSDQKAGDSGGLAFPGKAAPDYWDFLHFSIVIGVAAQTADIAFTGKALRRLGTTHSLFAFAFNTVVLALTINLLAGLF